MKIHDISQKVFGCKVYKGDPAPKKNTLFSIDAGDLYNLTEFSMCAHNGTHIDAPSHFLKNGANIDQIPLEKCVGECFVYEANGEINKEQAKQILEMATNLNCDCAKRILIKGDILITEQGATEFASANVFLIGVESQSVGSETSPMAVHKILLEKGTVLLEGINLLNVLQGEYFLCAQSLNLNGCEGAPCRAILIEK